MCVQQQVTHITQCFHLLIFPCLVKRMVITLIMTEKNFKKKKIVKFTQFCNLCKTLGKINVSRNCRHLRLEIS